MVAPPLRSHLFVFQMSFPVAASTAIAFPSRVLREMRPSKYAAPRFTTSQQASPWADATWLEFQVFCITYSAWTDDLLQPARVMCRYENAHETEPEPNPFQRQSQASRIDPVPSGCELHCAYPLAVQTTRCIPAELSSSLLPVPPRFDVISLCRAGPVRTSSQHLYQTPGSLAAHLPRTGP